MSEFSGDQKCNAAGRKITEDAEGLELYAYPDPGSPLGKLCVQRGIKARDYAEITNWQQISGDPWTIGYGHTGPEVKPGLSITAQRADELLEDDMEQAEHEINESVRYQLSSNRFSSLCDLVFNIGCHNFERSSALALINSGDLDKVPDHIMLWDKDHSGMVLSGLAKRRRADVDLWNTPDPEGDSTDDDSST